jgi:hypothetical protein
MLSMLQGGCSKNVFVRALLLSPRGVSRGVSLGEAVPSEARGDAVPNEVRGDAVPDEVRDASLSLGTTE